MRKLVLAALVALIAAALTPAVSAAREGENVVHARGMFYRTLMDVQSSVTVQGPAVNSSTATLEISWYGCGSSPGQPTVHVSLPLRPSDTEDFTIIDMVDREALGETFLIDYQFVDQGTVLAQTTLTDAQVSNYRPIACAPVVKSADNNAGYWDGTYENTPDYPGTSTIPNSSNDAFVWEITDGKPRVRLGFWFDPFASRPRVVKKPRVGKRAKITRATLSPKAVALSARLRYRWYFTCGNNGYLTPPKQTKRPVYKVPARVHYIPPTKRTYPSTTCRLNVDVVAKSRRFLEIGYTVVVGKVRS